MHLAGWKVGTLQWDRALWQGRFVSIGRANAVTGMLTSRSGTVGTFTFINCQRHRTAIFVTAQRRKVTFYFVGPSGPELGKVFVLWFSCMLYLLLGVSPSWSNFNTPKRVILQVFQTSILAGSCDHWIARLLLLSRLGVLFTLNQLLSHSPTTALVWRRAASPKYLVHGVTVTENLPSDWKVKAALSSVPMAKFPVAFALDFVLLLWLAENIRATFSANQL